MKIENNKITEFDFEDCENLFIPKNAHGIDFENMEYVGFFGGLKSITVEEGNSTFCVKNNCLIDIKTKTLITAAQNAAIPNDGSVETIFHCAFTMNESLKGEVIIPQGVKTIGCMAFKDTKATKFVIPASVENIYTHAFLDTHHIIKEIIVDKNNPYFYVESNCLIERAMNRVISVIDRNAEEIVIPQGITTIDNGVFFFLGSGKYDKVSIPSTVKEIGALDFCYKDAPIKCDDSQDFKNFCKEHNIVYAYDKSE